MASDAGRKRWLKPSTTMPNYGLSDEQVHDIVQWLLTLKCQPNQPACP